jgi:murein L,D-transpeptidase YcbB/YkuD
MQKNPNEHSYLNLISQSGRVVSREGIDFNQYNASNFPFDLKQPPSTRNALGLVKFMFPNQYNIYLHDTPAKSLFSRETRAFSHGCVRLHKPFDFAYALLSVQSSNPKGEFHTALDSGRETVIELKKHVPVHLMYRTAVSKPTGGMEYRRDIYGRDGAIFDALVSAGVVIGSIAG